MDSTTHTDNTQSTVPTTPGSPRKRSRESETTSEKHKREKAAERQRRKRQRDRSAATATLSLVGYPQADDQQPPLPAPSDFTGEVLTPDEAARRDRVRLAARERQRKHRQLVKQRKMRELGLDMGNEIMPGMEEVHYRVGADGQYQQVLPHELQHNPHAVVHHEPPFPHGQPLGGQTFASTMLLSFSCAPLLKQHLLRTLVMTNEELASLEPVLAEAWDRWDHQRRLHYAEASKAGGPGMPGHPPFPNVDMNDPANNPYGGDPSQQPQQPSPNDFRARFHRSLVAPSPFRTFGADTQTGPANSTPTSATESSATESAPPSDPIDPHLNGPVGGATNET